MGKTQVIYIVDDENTLREVVRRYLELDGFLVVEAESGPEALEKLREKPADLILLDIMLPGLDGFTITRSLRNAPEYQGALGGVPIIMLTSRGDEIDRITGFELGVDDYVVKPFSPRELVARVKAVLRRSASAGEPARQPLAFAGLHIDPLRRVVTLRGEPVTLTAKEFDLLWFFARHPQQVLTRDQLLNQVWGYEFYGDESTVTVHIRRLREKIEPDPSDPTYIHTVRGVGYKFDPN
ncbi:MAG: DNA-binding response regulator [Chloroflexi bacterium]|nr:DNA-binding response regulator [Chloroflexota bacterium]MDL1883771.1 response regulator transcription factor [Anaerolineae bacterium CFX8]GIL14669.1 MAG: DNA-binding response regulator [Chloroflexota bacterium]